MKNLLLSYTLAIVASGAAFLCQPASADTVTVDKQVETGPATVVDSWMQPTVVRNRAIKDADGTTSVTVQEPLVQERHEKVVVPQTETTTTTSVSQPPTEVTTEKRSSSYQASSVTPARKRHYVSHRRSCKPHTVARRPIAKKNFVASKEVVERKVEQRPAVVEQSQHSVQKETVIERRDPALDDN